MRLSGVWLGLALLLRGETARASGWLGRVGRLVEDVELDCAARGYLLVPAALAACSSGDAAGAYALSTEAGKVAAQFGDKDLAAFACLGQGQASIALGETARGVALLDEAMVSVTTGEVSPIPAGLVYCAVIETCMGVFDVSLTAIAPASSPLSAAVARRSHGPRPCCRAPTAARPVLPRPDGTLLITTSIAFPQKVFNVRRDPRVALLFSDPTGSGLSRAPQVLVQGTAVCPDEIVTGTAGLEEYWRRIYQRQPTARRYSANPVLRRAFDWYFMRLLITVTPKTISTRDSLPAVRRTPAPPAAGSAGVPAAAAAALAEYSSAVLGGRDTDGAPRLLRARPVPDPAVGAFTLDLPDAEPLVPGPACLLCHSHDEQLLNLRSVVVVGALARACGAWS